MVPLQQVLADRVQVHERAGCITFRFRKENTTASADSPIEMNAMVLNTPWIPVASISSPASGWITLDPC